MRTLMVWILLLCAFGTSGCDTSPEQRIQWLTTAIEQTETASANIDLYIADMEVLLQESQTLLATPELSLPQKDSIREAITDIQQKLQEAKDKKASIATALASWKAQLLGIQANGVTIDTEMQGYAEGIRALSTALPPPYNGIALLVAAVLPVAGGAVGRILTQMQDRKVLKAVTTSVSKGLNELAVDDQMRVTAAMKAVQEAKGVRDQVRAVLKE